MKHRVKQVIDRYRVWVLAILVCVIIALLGSLIWTSNTPEDSARRDQYSRNIYAARADNLVESFTYFRDEEADLCFVTYSSMIESITSVPCSEKVLELIRTQRQKYERR